MDHRDVKSYKQHSVGPDKACMSACQLIITGTNVVSESRRPLKFHEVLVEEELKAKIVLVSKSFVSYVVLFCIAGALDDRVFRRRRYPSRRATTLRLKPESVLRNSSPRREGIPPGALAA